MEIRVYIFIKNSNQKGENNLNYVYNVMIFYIDRIVNLCVFVLINF